MSPRKYIILFFLNLTIFSFAQCKTTEKKTAQDTSKIAVMKPLMNESLTTKLNKDKTMELHVVKKMKVGDPAFHFKYTVYEKGTKNIIKEGAFRGAAIDWNDKTSLKLVPYVGIEQKPISDNPDEILNKNTNTQLIIIHLNN